MNCLRISIAVLSTAALAAAAPQTITTRISVDSSGAQGNQASSGPGISTDGRWIAFSSTASNLVPGDTNGVSDVFVHDRLSGQTTRVSVDSQGIEGDDASYAASERSISSDGRYVVFSSLATNLVAVDTNNAEDIFVHDRQTAQTTRVSVSSSGAQANLFSQQPTMTPDGRYVAFMSDAGNLGSANKPLVYEVFRHDRQTGQTINISLASQGILPNNDCGSPSISADGRYVLFESNASNLASGDTNGVDDLFLRDTQTGQTTRVSLDSLGVEGNAEMDAGMISADARYVAFTSDATNLVAGDTNAKRDAFLRDLQTGQTTRISVDAQGTGGDQYSERTSISSDGRYVAFSTRSGNLVAADTNATWDVFVHDRLTGQLERISVDSQGAQTDLGSNSGGSISDDGRSIAFYSTATNLVAGDTNAAGDVFVRDRWAPCTISSYCTSSTTTNGCVPTMAASGTASVSSSSGFVLTASGLEGQKLGLILFGVSGRNAAPWAPASTSFLCVKFPAQRTSLANSAGNAGACDGAISIDWLAYLDSHSGAVGQPFTAGVTVNAQCLFRDGGAPRGTNLSDGVEFVTCP